MEKANVVSKEYNVIKERLNPLQLNDKLLIISNLLFDCYPDTIKHDLLYKGISVPPIQNLENYSELTDIYSFKKDALTYNVLSSAHTVLSCYMEVNKKLNVLDLQNKEDND